MTATTASPSPLAPIGGAAVPRALPYLPGLDGLRALSVLAVVGYHADVTGLSGGFLGVEVFFVLSGYLITTLLVAERERTGWIDLADFWRRRALRLLPAVAVMLAAVSAGALLVWRDALDQLRGDVVAAVLYMSNWWQIVEDRSYFESTGRPPMLQHLWSLAVEEQFYLLFPLVLAVALRRSRRTLVAAGLVAVGLASAWWMSALHEPYADPSRVYYGTDTRLSGLLLGAALAFVVVPGASRRPGRRVLSPTDAVGVAGLAVLAWAFVRINEFDPFVYRGGFVMVDLATLAIIVAVARTDGALGRILGVGPLRWVGTRSYAIYLWHWPIVVVTRPGLDIALDGPALVALRVGLTLALAEASYRFVERPIRAGELRLWPSRGIMHAAPGRIRYVFPVVAVATLPLVAVMAGVGAAPSSPATELVVAAPEAPGPPSPATGPGGAAGDRPSGTEAPTAPVPAPTSASTGPAVPDETPSTTADATPSEAPPAPVATAAGTPTVAAAPPSVLAIGDSVMLGAAPALEAAVPGIVVDASVARQLPDATASLRWWMSETDSIDVVVVHVGTNGAFGDAQLDELARAAAPARLVLLEASAPRAWIPLVNERLASGAARHDGTLVRWRDAVDAAGGPGPDGIHLPPRAAGAYAEVVAAAVRQAAGT
ncbi:MAG TPA: acyltransferase family protein [Acidimicrobiales bacterium]|nr:acyltransferase family protein [Acidimicrobiales bacterium]